MIRLGVIGIGNMGAFHAARLQEQKVNNCQLTAVCDIEPAKYSKIENVKKFTDSKELIRSGSVDAVLIATPHYSHTTIGIDALDNGLHVLVEKPISVHKADCERLIDAHKRNPKLVFAAMFNQRTDPHYQRIRKMIKDGALGKIQRITWIITDWFRAECYYESGGWRATWKGEGGGVLLNQAPHNLDLWQWFFGMPESITGFCGFGKYHNIEVEDDVTAYMKYPDGAIGVLITTTGELPGTNRLEIAGDNGKLTYENGLLIFIKNEIPISVFNKTTKEGFGRSDVWNVSIPINGFGGQHVEIIQNFVDVILNGGELIAPAEEGIKSVELANAIVYSSLRRETIGLPLDAAGYEKVLMKLIAESKFEKKTIDNLETDMSKSFH